MEYASAFIIAVIVFVVVGEEIVLILAGKLSREKQ